MLFIYQKPKELIMRGPKKAWSGGTPIGVSIAKDCDEMSRRVAEMAAAAIKPGVVLGLATGGMLLGRYRELIRMHREGGLDFSRVTTSSMSMLGYHIPTLRAIVIS